MRVHDYLEFHAQQRPGAEFAICAGKRITYGEAQDKANRISHALIASGLETGDRIAILGKNSIEMVLLYHGAFKAGIVPTPINYRLMPSDWLQVCQDAETKLFISDARFSADVDAIRGQLDGVRSFIMTSGRPSSGWEDMGGWSTAYAPREPDVESREDEDVLQLYTSGTTGPPKGAVLTHRAVTANIAQLGLVARFRPGDRFLIVMPLDHAAGIMAMLHAVSWGASLFIQQSFEPAKAINALSQEGVVATMMVPTMIRMCLSELADVSDRRFDSLRLIIYGGSPIDEKTLRRAMKVFRCDFAQRYGTTETLSLSWLGPAEHRRSLAEKPELLRSAGHPLPGTEIRVVDENDRPVPIGGSGEFVVRGPQLMKGYWKSTGETGDVLRDGWMHTGDAGYMDRDGYIYICDRVQDLIVSGGENIYPYEIEAVLTERADVAEAAVIGVPDTKWGEAVKAVVVLQQGANTTTEQLIDHCRGKLARFKVPHSIDFVARLPRNPTAKVLKHELREPYWRGHNRRI
jgi:acyl-CoA synthetase (AMP-forming)/AMP-acid ligase II